MSGAVRTLAPDGGVTPTGPWSLGARAGDFIFIAGMRGIDPATGALVEGEEPRIRQAFRNMLHIAASEGVTAADCVRLTVFVTEMSRHRAIANKIQQELWGDGPYPPRTLVEVKALNQNDIFEVEGTFHAPLTG